MTQGSQCCGAEGGWRGWILCSDTGHRREARYRTDHGQRFQLEFCWSSHSANYAFGH